MSPRTNGRASVGHPVDVKSGTLFLETDDFVLEGRVALAWPRRFSTALLQRPPAALHGPGWWSEYEVVLTRDLEGFRVTARDGEHDIEFDDEDGSIDAGEIIRNLGEYAELSRLPDGRYVVTAWNPETARVTRSYFDDEGPGPWPLQSFEEVGRGLLDLFYDSNGHLTHIQQRREQRTLAIDRDVLGLVSVLRLLLPGEEEERIVARFVYDSRGRLIRQSDAAGFETRYRYDEANRLISEAQPSGAIYEFVYDGRGRCVSTGAQEGYDLKLLEYGQFGDWTQATNGRGATTRYEFDTSGRIIRQTSPTGLVSSFAYDDYGRPIRQVLAEDAGVERVFAYDEAGNQAQVTIGGDLAFTLAFNTLHQPVRLLEPGDREWRRDYTGIGQVALTVNPLGERWESRYDELGDLIEIVNPAGSRRQITYDLAGDIVAITDWEGRPSNYEYEGRGLLTRWVDAMGRETRMRWDENGDLAWIRSPDGGERRYERGPNGEITTIVDENGFVHRISYLFSGYTSEVQLPNGSSYRFHWTTEPGELAAIENGRGERHLFERDLEGRVALERTFDGRTFAREYDGPLMRRETNSRGDVTAFDYDRYGGLTRREHADGSWVELAYNPVTGKIVRARNAACALTFTHDANGRLLLETTTAGDEQFSVASRYDVMGNRVERTTSTGHRTQYRHSPNGWLTTIDSSDGALVRLDYNDNGEEISRTLPGGGVVLQSRDPLGRLVTQQVERGGRPGLDGRAAVGGPTVARRYEYDPHGNVIGERDERWGDTQYSYDPAERLLRALRSSGLDEHFDYDLAGDVRRGSIPTPSIREGEWLYGESSRLERAPDHQYRYDELGRVVERETPAHPRQALRWDDEDHLVELVTADGETWQYTYDPLGRRIAKERVGPAGGGDAVRFWWDGDQIVEERDIGGNQRRWTYQPDSFTPLAVHDAARAETLYCVTDVSDVVRELVRSDGSVAWSAQHATFGLVVGIEAAPGVDCPLRFEGQWFDEESGLHYNYQRYYDPHVGRYLSPDPLEARATPNPYEYTVNPIGWTDPWGLAQCPKKKRGQKKTVNSGADAPAKGGIYEFTDNNGNRYVGSTNDFQVRMNKHIADGRLPPGSVVKFNEIDVGTRASGQPPSEKGARRIRRFFEQESIGTNSNGDVQKNPSSGWAAVRQSKWDAHGQGRDYSSSYFD